MNLKFKLFKTFERFFLELSNFLNFRTFTVPVYINFLPDQNSLSSSTIFTYFCTAFKALSFSNFCRADFHRRYKVPIVRSRMSVRRTTILLCSLPPLPNRQNPLFEGNDLTFKWFCAHHGLAGAMKRRRSVIFTQGWKR